LADYVLGEFELLLMSDVSWSSFDGRYFGPVDVGQVRGVIKPLIVFQDFFGILDKKRDEELSVPQLSGNQLRWRAQSTTVDKAF
jgi:hypothetical protein